MRPHRDLVVSIHDVSPLTREATEAMLADLAGLGVRKVTLLVIPDHHCKGHFLDHPEFCAWLRERVAQGDEVAIHGYFHRRDQRAGETLKAKLATRYYTAGEGEFFDIPGADALRIVSQARQEFHKVGLDPQGFVAPAWLLSDGADRALQRLGIAYTTRIGGIFDYTTGIRHTSQSLVWSSRSWWRRIASRAWNAYLFRRLQTCNLLRIGIHPTDRQHPAVWRQIRTLIARALEDRAAITYGGYLKKR
ncbi:MAG: polysaccharide deacetylase family protein [Verrucomicrobiota bacterium]